MLHSYTDPQVENCFTDQFTEQSKKQFINQKPFYKKSKPMHTLSQNIEQQQSLANLQFQKTSQKINSYQSPVDHFQRKQKKERRTFEHQLKSLMKIIYQKQQQIEKYKQTINSHNGSRRIKAVAKNKQNYERPQGQSTEKWKNEGENDQSFFSEKISNEVKELTEKISLMSQGQEELHQIIEDLMEKLKRKEMEYEELIKKYEKMQSEMENRSIEMKCKDKQNQELKEKIRVMIENMRIQNFNAKLEGEMYERKIEELRLRFEQQLEETEAQKLKFSTKLKDMEGEIALLRPNAFQQSPVQIRKSDASTQIENLNKWLHFDFESISPICVHPDSGFALKAQHLKITSVEAQTQADLQLSEKTELIPFQSSAVNYQEQQKDSAFVVPSSPENNFSKTIEQYKQLIAKMRQNHHKQVTNLEEEIYHSEERLLKVYQQREVGEKQLEERYVEEVDRLEKEIWNINREMRARDQKEKESKREMQGMKEEIEGLRGQLVGLKEQNAKLKGESEKISEKARQTEEQIQRYQLEIERLVTERQYLTSLQSHSNPRPSLHLEFQCYSQLISPSFKSPQIPTINALPEITQSLSSNPYHIVLNNPSQPQSKPQQQHLLSAPSNPLLSFPSLHNISHISYHQNTHQNLLNSSFEEKLQRLGDETNRCNKEEEIKEKAIMKSVKFCAQDNEHSSTEEQQQEHQKQSPSFVEYQNKLLESLQRQCQEPSDVFLGLGNHGNQRTKMVELSEVRQNLKMTKQVNFQLFDEINRQEKIINEFKSALKAFLVLVNSEKKSLNAKTSMWNIGRGARSGGGSISGKEFELMIEKFEALLSGNRG